MSSARSWKMPSLPRVDVVTASSQDDLVLALADGRRPFAGGTDILLTASASGEPPPRLVWTGSVPELRQLDRRDGLVHIGAAVTYSALLQASVAADIPAVADGARVVGSVQIRNAATVIGNICNASPAADAVPGLVVHAAKVTLLDSRGGERRLDLASFLRGPGQTAISPHEAVTMVTATLLAAREGSAYRRFTIRNSMDLAFVGVAARVAVDDDGQTIRDASIALGAVGPTVIVANEAAQLLIGSRPTVGILSLVGRTAAAETEPISDIRASASYRRHVAEVMVGDVIKDAHIRARERP